MRPRPSLTEIFSSFIQFEADRFSGWATDFKLRRSMQNCLVQMPEVNASENFWALYWYKLWQTQPASLAGTHLSAYLQETCYWSVQKTITSLASTQYKLSDCFQIAIAQLDKILKAFNPDQGSMLKIYAGVAFRSRLKDTLRQRQEADICTEWALLRKLSQKQLVASLENAGFTSEKIARYLLAWNCFKTSYVPTRATGTRQLPKPDRATWEAIAKLFNTQRQQQLNSPGAECNPETLEQLLTQCASRARAYLYPPKTSLNAPLPGQTSGELQDDLSDTLHESLLTELIAQEETQNRQTQQAQLKTVLATAIEKLDPQVQKLLQLY
jgi:RNA polymerase sigma factor (sigma-70 family)